MRVRVIDNELIFLTSLQVEASVVFPESDRVGGRQPELSPQQQSEIRKIWFSEATRRPALGCSCRLRRAGLQGAVRPSHGATLQLDTVSVVEQAVADGVGLVGVADDGVPVGDGQLTGDEG